MKKEIKVKNKPTYSIRGKLIEAKIIRMKSKLTASVEVKNTKFIPKYERYILKKSHFSVHVPEGMDVVVGDIVLCGETRKISKTKSMIIIKKVEPTNEPKKEKLKKQKTTDSKEESDEEWNK